MYINFKCDYTGEIETVEDTRGLTSPEIRALLEDYRLSGGNYWLSQRAVNNWYDKQKESGILK